METKLLRKTKTYCPFCVTDVEGEVILQGNDVLLRHLCPEHGNFDFKLSSNGECYSDLDSFFFKLKGFTPQGRITMSWVLTNYTCNMNCSYCNLQAQIPYYDNLGLEDFKNILDNFKHYRKICLAGGEPTVNEKIFEIIKMATGRGVITAMATNGLKLTDDAFLKQIISSGLNEVRLSIHTLTPETNLPISNNFYKEKLDALKCLERYNMPTILSPIIFKGYNEDQVVECLEYAKDKPFIKEIAVDGFSWVGNGSIEMDKSLMIMPDEIMDSVFKKYFQNKDRKEIFTFQKLVLLTLFLFKIRLCLYTQIMVFLRVNKSIRPVTGYLNMRRLDKSIQWWMRFNDSSYFIKLAAFLIVVISSLKFKTFKILFPGLKLILANIFRIKIYKYPRQFLALMINTNCSLLSADDQQSIQCMNGAFAKSVFGDVISMYGTKGFLYLEKTKKDGLSKEKLLDYMNNLKINTPENEGNASPVNPKK